MHEYLERRASDGQPFPLIGGNARTGLPLRLMIDPAQLKTVSTSPTTAP
jgi:hypothetical protein